MLKLRDYQKEAIEKVTQEWDKGKKNTLLIMPTGTGKTIVFTSIINQIVKNDDSKKKKVLILAQRGELLKQAGEKLDNIFNIPSALEKAQSFALNASEPVTLGSMQSFKQDKRLESYPKDYFDTIIIDEAHHTMSESYLKIIKHFDSAKLLGVTATPERNDKQKLGDVYDSIAYEYKIYEAIENKDLCPIVAKFDPMKINIKNVKVKDNNFNMQEIGEIVDKHIQCLSHRLKEHCKGKKAVIFFPQIETAQKYCEALRQKGVKAVEINNKTKDRDKILEDYKEGKYDVICNTDLLTEGWDCPNVDCVISLRPTISHSLYLQMHGRGLRNAPNKKNLTVIDFAWETDKDIERPSHLISESVEEEAFIDNLLFTNSNGFDLLEAKKAYDKHLEGQIEEKLKAFNTAEKKQDIEKKINNNSNIDKIKLMDYLTLIDSSIIHTYKNENQNNDISASDQQLKQLESFGLDINIPFFTFTRNLVNSIKEILLERQIRELASPKDMLFLIKNGYSYSANWDQRAVNQIKKNYNFKKDYNVYKWDKAEEKQLQYLQKFEFKDRKSVV